MRQAATRLPTSERAIVEQLERFFSWEEAVGVVREACVIHLRWSYLRLRALSPHVDADLPGRVRRLPVCSQERLLLAPAMQQALDTRPMESVLCRVLDFIEAEERLARGECLTGWSPRGDLYRCAFSQVADAAEWCPDRAWRAPRVAHLVLDTRCPHNALRAAERRGAIHPHSADEMPQVGAHIAQAVAHLDARCEPAAAMLRACVQVLRAGKADPRHGFSTSYSHRNLIGCIGLLNAHDQMRWTLPNTLNDLLREGVRTLLYKVELSTPLCLNSETASRLTHRSPWSGRAIDQHSYVHSCFGWYALWAFWRRYPDPTEETRRLQERARGGFLCADPLASLDGEAAANIFPDVRAAIARIRERVGEAAP